MQRVPWRVTKVVLGADRSSYVLLQNKATVMAGTCLYIGLFASKFLYISVNWSYKLAVDLQKDEVLPVSHLLISYNSNLPSGPLGPSQIGNFCEMLGIHKLNTTSYDPQCDGMVQLHIEVSSQETCSQVW